MEERVQTQVKEGPEEVKIEEAAEVQTAEAQEGQQAQAGSQKIQYWGTGRRKTAVARVRLIPGGTGQVIINKRTLEDYFPREDHRKMIFQPFEVTNLMGKFDVYVNVRGGGISGQAGAIRHGIARALLEYNPELRPILRKAGLLTRDPRMKERKKYGQKGARAKFQWTKR